MKKTKIDRMACDQQSGLDFAVALHYADMWRACSKSLRFAAAANL